MKSTNTFLLCAFALQICLAGGLLWNKHTGDNDSEKKTLLTVNTNTINRIHIEDNSGNKVILEKTGGQWVLPDYHKLPIRPSKISSLLGRLNKARTPWPIATTTASHQRFQVADDKFQRRLDFFKGDKQVEGVYLGTSPGFKQVHARNRSADAVFSVGFSAFEAPAKYSDWFDKSLLRIPETPNFFEGPGYRLTKEGSQWTLPEDSNVEPAQEPITRLAEALLSFNVHSATSKPDQEQEKITLKAGAGKRVWRYQFFKAYDEYFVERDDLNTTFKISERDFNNFAGVTAESLVRPAAIEKPNKN